MSKWNLVALVLVVAAGGCASKYTVIDRSAIVVSDSARISAQNLVADAQRFPRVAEHLGLAQEVYQQQLRLLKERRNKVRGRRRLFGLLSFSAYTVGALAVGYFAGAGLMDDGAEAETNHKYAAVSLLPTLAGGIGFQVGALMQEDTSAIDAKVEQLDLMYDTMMDRLRDVSREATQPVCDASVADCPAVINHVNDLSARMSEVIEEFIADALSIHVKG